MTFMISPQAEFDLAEIWDYIAADSPNAADIMIGRVLEHARLVSTQPRMGRPRWDLAPEVRSSPVGPYLMFYRPREASGIWIVRIIHGRRDITPDLF